MDVLPYLTADRDFYRPAGETTQVTTTFEVQGLPGGWETTEADFWKIYTPVGTTRATHGWKVHVSAAAERAQHVLDTAAAICVELGVSFKHLRNDVCFTLLHHKHGNRAQGGKFIAAYPPDAEAARLLMEALAKALDGVQGPHILGDRRFRESSVVAYRYGAFEPIAELRADGTRELMVPDGTGHLVPDVRGVSFKLPPGIEDPFVQPAELAEQAKPVAVAPPPAAPEAGRITFEGLRFEQVVRHSNGGGTYLAVERASGRQVFVKEARALTGLDWDGGTAAERLAHEYRTLRDLHGIRPGLAPEPLDYFQCWEHTFLVTEVLPGRTLMDWVINLRPGFYVTDDPAPQRTYHERCLRILAQLGEQLGQLHAAGYAFVDVSPGNVLVDEDDNVRLIDFEAATRIGEPLPLFGTPGYHPAEPRARLREIAAADPLHFDRYGLAGLAKLMLFGNVHHVLQREPAVLDHLVANEAAIAPLPEQLLAAAAEFVESRATGALPSAAEVAAAPEQQLRRLCERIADGLLAMARPDADPVFPTVPRGYLTNRRCVAYGTAGVLHALRLAGRTADPALVRRLADDSLRLRDRTPPGLHVGNAGIAWVLADHGLLDEANALLATAEQDPLLRQRATLGEGVAGVAMAHLALYGHDRDERHLDRAAQLRATVPDDPELTPLLGPDDATGLLHGRPGLALLDYYLHHLAGDPAAIRRGLALLRAEATRAVDYPGGGIAFRISTTDARLFPYLHRGSAGLALVATRYLAHSDELATLVEQCLIPSSVPTTAYSGLYEGRAGLVLALADHASRTGSQAVRQAAVAAARRLFCHAVTDPDGVRFCGEHMFRLSADLWSGSAGVLLALTRLLDGPADVFFTLDELVSPTR
ncbi:hypothetical protein P3T36_005267 [Kitasatospora sp. MAP12-15]|uniref:class III lanthionine synthetase LanKC n=1 Tax=unclassified Kitasatospora TaxID=2633591 RepID=UPI002475FB1A|nr:class III lanthionine synthetase LanKC [Kitasatospora sp. MAP12-44]MDH6113570.1 hypothetical protein [Kitasatospora sp. MAP12-44]